VNAAGGSQVNSELQQGSYVKVNGAITWTHGNLTLRGWVQNLLQEKTLAYGLDLRGAGFPFNYLVPAQPRTYGGSVRFTF
jgi:outer membrane receptor protein involved in Fe transport